MNTITNSKVDAFIRSEKHWQAEYTIFREILLSCDLTEDFKWRHPCYMIDGKNVVLMHGFKNYCALLFDKGVLLKDEKKILVQQTENVQSARQIRFTGFEEIEKLSDTIKAYILEAIALEKSGATVEYKKTDEYPVPDELQSRFNKDPNFKAAFKALTPGRQRGYLLYFNGAKQSATRESRIEKCAPKIFEGLGLND